jgi:hypothetical protein
MNQAKTDEQKKYRIVLWLMFLIFLLCVLIILLQKFSPTPLPPNRATLDAFTQQAYLTLTSIQENTKLPTSTTFITETVPPTPNILVTLPPTFNTTVNQPSFCHNGPNLSYLGAIPLSVGTQVEILAMSDSGDWFMIRGKGIDTCWVEASVLNLTTNIPLDKLLVFTTVITTEETPCRIYTSAERPIQTFIPKSRRVVIYGKSNPTAEWLLVVPHDSTKPCWIENNYPIDLSSLPFELPDVTLRPTETPSPTLTATLKPFFPTPTHTRRRSDDNNNNNPTPIPPTYTPGAPPTSPPTNTPIPPPTNTPIPPPTLTPTLCWPPGHCK